jgi:hypothetical protein
MARRGVFVALPAQEYQRLRALAEREDRAVDQQAAHILRRALCVSDTTDDSEKLGHAGASWSEADVK